MNGGLGNLAKVNCGNPDVTTVSRTTGSGAKEAEVSVEGKCSLAKAIHIPPV